MTVLFRPNTQQKRRIMNRVTQLADQEKENLNLAERNRALADSLADELKKSSSRSSSSSSKKPTPTIAVDLDGRLKAMMGLIQGLRENLEKETGAREELHKQLTKERAERREDVEALRQVRFLFSFSHRSAHGFRQKILNHIECDTWEDLRQDKSIYNLAEHVYAHPADTEHPPSRGAVQFLCSYNNVRRSGNSVAHTAKAEEVKAAVTTRQLELTERWWLEQLYMFTYGEPV
ncbi:hypothetical protein PILCRDRAFT_744773 [Piloderma croceum F 1598]|uniref:Uncharacterized protein n=1 Tax=Piloderma croceum (strain F 1598) TaxID=765440 RepID=A0A0C3B4I4_PILCF|nr:hypothetical protein PILCRDRAFT_744773 [Piloderma croceum F 1598]